MKKLCVSILLLFVMLFGAISQDLIKPTFKWTIPSNREVYVERNKVEKGDLEKRTSFKYKYIQKTTQQTDGSIDIVAIYDDVLILNGKEYSKILQDDSMVPFMISMQPPIKISADGDFKSMLEGEKILGYIQSTNLGKYNDEVSKKIIGYSFPEAMKAIIESKISQEWMAIVSIWKDNLFENGKTYEVDTQNTLPLFSNELITYRQYYKVERRPDNLLEMEFSSYPDENEVAHVLESIISKSTNSPKLDINAYKIMNIINLLADEKTLEPKTCTIKKLIEVTNNENKITSSEETVIYSFGKYL
jgi:hypothetical protein